MSQMDLKKITQISFVSKSAKIIFQLYLRYLRSNSTPYCNQFSVFKDRQS